jgi:peptidoglycan hydrolase-like protein with peptidoglycan-binding domain
MVLKRGDNNEVVKKIQVVLGVEAVGNFGPKTEEAVKAWQTKNGLKADGIVGPATLAKMGIAVDSKPAAPKPAAVAKYTAAQIKTAVASKGYKWFEGKDLMLNIVGVRNSSTGLKVTNLFDDHLTLSYTVDGVEHFHCWPATTDPGTKGVMQFGNKAGVARLVEGQYINSHIIRLHAGKYEALGQNKPVKVYRDNNMDGKYDMLEENIKEGIFGINIHRATANEGGKSTQIDKWSAGCQVIAANDDFKLLMELAHKAADLYGKSFTYTLIESKDIL